MQDNSNCSDSFDDYKVLEIMLLFWLLIYLSLSTYSQYNSLNFKEEKNLVKGNTTHGL